MFTRETPNVKREIEQTFSKSKNLPNFDLLGARGQGVFNFSIFTAIGTSLRESTSFEPFCVKIG